MVSLAYLFSIAEWQNFKGFMKFSKSIAIAKMPPAVRRTLVAQLFVNVAVYLNPVVHRGGRC